MEIKNGVTPAYLQIEEDLRKKIESGYYKVDDRLSEQKLVKVYNVSRLTLRKATSILAAEGYLSHVQGKGTFVTSPDGQNKLQNNDVRFKKLNKSIGILIPCVTFSLYPGIIRGAEDFAREHGYHIILGNYDVNPEKEKEYMESFVHKGISGLVISASYTSRHNSYYRTLKKNKIPFVIIDTVIPGLETDFVGTDNVQSSYSATCTLIKKGCKKNAFISGYFQASSSKERFTGYKNALEENGLRLDNALVREGPFSEEFGYKATKEIISKNKIDGIFSANEPLLPGVLRVIKEQKKNSGIKVVSFDKPEIPLGLAYPCVFIVQPRYDIGRVACELLLERIKEKRGKTQTPYKKILLQPEVIEAGKERR